MQRKDSHLAGFAQGVYALHRSELADSIEVFAYDQHHLFFPSLEKHR